MIRVDVKVRSTYSAQAVSRGVRRAAVDGLNAAAVSMQGTMRNVLSIAKSPGPAGGPPGVVTGELRSSIKIGRASLGNLSSFAGSMSGASPHGLQHARFMQYGVRSSGTLLTVPLNPAARAMRAVNPSLRAVPGLFYIPSRSSQHRGILAMKQGKRIRPMFVLKSFIAPRPWRTLSHRVGRAMSIYRARLAFKESWRGQVASMASRAAQ